MLLENNKTKLTQTFHFGMAGTLGSWPARAQRTAQENTHVALHSMRAAAPPGRPSGLLVLCTPCPKQQAGPGPGNFFPT